MMPSQAMRLRPVNPVSLLLHMEGTNGSQTFIDSSRAPKQVIATGNAQISTARSKFGSASALFDGTGDYIDTSQPQGYSTADFTIEGFVYFNSFTSAPTIVDNRVSGPSVSLVIYNPLSTTNLTFFSGGSNRASSGNLSTATWYHFALCRASGISRFFIDGVQQGSNYADTSNYNHSGLRFGANSSGTSSLDGNLDEIRGVTGFAYYTANFTPPSAAFPDV